MNDKIDSNKQHDREPTESVRDWALRRMREYDKIHGKPIDFERINLDNIPASGYMVTK